VLDVVEPDVVMLTATAINNTTNLYIKHISSQKDVSARPRGRSGLVVNHVCTAGEGAQRLPGQCPGWEGPGPSWPARPPRLVREEGGMSKM